MEKIKADILINGDLICEQKLNGGGQIYSTSDVEKYFDASNAIIIDGDVNINSIDSKNYIIVITGSVITKGGSYGKR